MHGQNHIKFGFPHITSKATGHVKGIIGRPNPCLSSEKSHLSDIHFPLIRLVESSVMLHIHSRSEVTQYSLAIWQPINSITWYIKFLLHSTIHVADRLYILCLMTPVCSLARKLFFILNWNLAVLKIPRWERTMILPQHNVRILYILVFIYTPLIANIVWFKLVSYMGWAV